MFIWTLKDVIQVICVVILLVAWLSVKYTEWKWKRKKNK
jgi:hypothetical protein